MTPSTRTPTRKQGQILFALAGARANEGEWPSTKDVVAKVASIQRSLKSLTPVYSQRDVFHALTTFTRYEWVQQQTALPGYDNEGSHLRWFITPAGREALQRALQANTPPKENAMEATTTTEPPTQSAPYDDPITEPAQEPDPDLQQLDENIDPKDVQVEDPDAGDGDEPSDEREPNIVNEGASQLTLAIGGPKPVESTLKIRTKTIKYGSSRQFKQIERIPITAVLEIRRVGSDVPNNGKALRFHEAVLTEIELSE